MLLLIGFCYDEYSYLIYHPADIAEMLKEVARILTVMFDVKKDFNTALG